MILEAPADTTLTTDTPPLTTDTPLTDTLALATDSSSAPAEAPGDAPTEAPGEPPAPAPGGATYGWEMFVAFLAAVLAITVAVCVLALVGSWWMLGVAVAVHIGITATMMWLVFGSFGAEEHQYPDFHTAEAASRAAIAAQASLRAARPRLALHH